MSGTLNALTRLLAYSAKGASGGHSASAVCRGASCEETGSAGRDGLRLVGSHVKHCPLAARPPHPPPQLPASIAEVARVRSVACLSASRFTVAAAAGDGFRVIEHDAQRR